MTDSPLTAWRKVAQARQARWPRFRGLSDGPRLGHISPTIVLLLAINIFPLIWTVYLSFTNYRANRPGRPIKWVGTRNYERLLGARTSGATCRPSSLRLLDMALQVLLGLGLALLINRTSRAPASGPR